jgi:hypothetical protein
MDFEPPESDTHQALIGATMCALEIAFQIGVYM